MLGGHRDPNMGDLEIRGFVIREFPFSQKSANCKDFLYLCILQAKHLQCEQSFQSYDEMFPNHIKYK